MYKIAFTVPEVDVEKVKAAIFAAGAGQLNNYSHCSWQTQGIGQYMPLAGSEPTIGKVDQLTLLPEILVETICLEKYIKTVIKALKSAHPYEEPAYQVLRLEDF